MLIEQQSDTIDACRFCFMCRHVCTLSVVSGWESDTPRGKGLLLSRILKGHATYDSDFVQTIYRCCLCGVCHSWCVGGYNMPEAILAARRDIVDQAREPSEAQQIKANILETGNPFGLPAVDRFKAIQDGTPFKETADVVYYVGCDVAYHQPEIANTFTSILSRSRVNFTLLKNETSSGKPLTVLGYCREAADIARRLAAHVRSTGCRLLVTTCPSSYDAFKKDYGTLFEGIEVLHATEYIARLMQQGVVSPEAKLQHSVALHDSDYLCRYNGVCDEPRQVLQSIPGVALREMSWTRDKAHSCGEVGGVFSLMFPELGERLPRRLLDEAKCTGAQILATTCPVTKRALIAVNETDMEIRDVVEVFAESLGS
jgi:Fe-S oxidoreductase